MSNRTMHRTPVTTLNTQAEGPRAPGRSAPVRQEKLLAPQDISDRTGLNVEVIRRAIRRKELRAVNICRRIRIKEADYEAWLARSVI
jgi:excisionase family DNA binding protein